jgi:hypothetical protein
MAPALPPSDPLAGARGLAENVAMGAWLSPAELALRINVPGPALGWSVGWMEARYGEKLPVYDGSDGKLAWLLLAAQLTILTILMFLA